MATCGGWPGLTTTSAAVLDPGRQRGLRPLFLQASCASLAQIANGVSGSSLLLNLAPILGASGPAGATTGQASVPRTRAPPPPPAADSRWPSTRDFDIGLRRRGPVELRPDSNAKH